MSGVLKINELKIGELTIDELMIHELKMDEVTIDDKQKLDFKVTLFFFRILVSMNTLYNALLCLILFQFMYSLSTVESINTVYYHSHLE